MRSRRRRPAPGTAVGFPRPDEPGRGTDTGRDAIGSGMTGCV